MPNITKQHMNHGLSSRTYEKTEYALLSKMKIQKQELPVSEHSTPII